MNQAIESGIFWTKQIPLNWKVEKIKNYFRIISGSGFAIELQGIDSGDIPVLKAGDISASKKYIYKANNYISKSLAQRLFNIIPENSIVMPKIGEAMKKNSRAINTVECCVDNNCQGVIPVNINHEFSYYLFCCIDMNWFDNAGTIPCINVSKLCNSKFAFPNIETQVKIASLLNKKCGEIDGLISDIEKEIEILTQYKKSIITETVTKGLNKNIKLKNSGIEWAKHIPEHWEVSRIANVYKLRNQKVSDKDFEPLSVTMKGIFPQLENVAKSDAHDDRKLVRKGDFAINSRSDRRGSCGISDRDGSVSLINLVLQPLTNMNPNYYNWLFHTESFADEFYKWGHGIVNDLWTTNWQDMKRILIPQPPIQEQREIAEYLDKKCKEIDAILEDKNKQLEILESYKKSIIYEYVTGKKEVK